MKRQLLTAIYLTLSSLVMAAYLPKTSPKKVGMDASRLSLADSAINHSIEKGEIPGAVLAVVRHGKMAYLKAYGNRQVAPTTEEMTTNTIFDMASCSKSMSTAICTMILCERGEIRLQDPVSMYIPDFKNFTAPDGEKYTIRIRHLLNHTSGLPAYASVTSLQKEYGESTPEVLLRHICNMKRLAKPDTEFRYSCLNYITLQHIIQNVSKKSLRHFALENIFLPLGMEHTDYLPTTADAEKWKDIIAPTTVYEDGSTLRGQVHDPLARVMNHGISGNAGLFTSAEDAALLCAMLQNGGEWNGVRILSAQTVKAMRTARAFGRTYGWDVSSPYASCNGDLFSEETYGHTGFTGTSIVIDPINDCSVILLVNAVHPGEGKSNMVRLRSVISNIVASSIIK